MRKSIQYPGAVGTQATRSASFSRPSRLNGGRSLSPEYNFFVEHKEGNHGDSGAFYSLKLGLTAFLESRSIKGREGRG